jgi:hypothetical protein
MGGLVIPGLTPDARGLPGGLTLVEFENAMSTGHDPHRPDSILQIMPWPVYREMIPCDQVAIYEFLKAIPSSPPAP